VHALARESGHDRRTILQFLLVSPLAVRCRRPSDRPPPEAEAEASPPGASPAARADGPRPASALRRFDAHLHLAPGGGLDWAAFRTTAGIASGLNLSGGWPGGILETSLRTAAGRWLVAVSLPWHYAAHPRFAVASADAVGRAAELGARALKIDKALGLSARREDGSLWAVDAPELDPLFDAAGRAGLPVFIHTADPRAFWRPPTPDNPRYAELSVHPAWSYHDRDVPSFDTLWSAFARRVARHPDTRFVGVHFGNRAEDPNVVSALLDRTPNLWIDLAARLPELGKHAPEVLRPIFHRHRDRILFGTDFGVMGPEAFMLGSTGESPSRWDDIGPFYERSHSYLADTSTVASMTPIQGDHVLRGLGLPQDILHDIYWNNAERLLGPLPDGTAG